MLNFDQIHFVNLSLQTRNLRKSKLKKRRVIDNFNSRAEKSTHSKLSSNIFGLSALDFIRIAPFSRA